MTSAVGACDLNRVVARRSGVIRGSAAPMHLSAASS